MVSHSRGFIKLNNYMDQKQTSEMLMGLAQREMQSAMSNGDVPGSKEFTDGTP